MRRIFYETVSAAAIVAMPAAAAPPADGAHVAAAFGARISMWSADLSPDGSHLSFLAPGDDKTTLAVVQDLATGEAKAIGYADGKPLKMTYCGWSAADRVACGLYGITVKNGTRLSWGRMFAVDSTGRKEVALGLQTDETSLGMNQNDGYVVDWLTGEDGRVLMARNVVPKQSTGTSMQVSREGMDVELVDTRTGAGKQIEQPNAAAAAYFSDGDGTVRMMALEERSNTGQLTGKTIYKYRLPGQRAWQVFSAPKQEGPGLRPLAVDGATNVAYATDKKDGRDALYRVALDGTMKTELVYADPKVDVGDVVRVGRRNHVIGVSYTTDEPHVVYLDPKYATLANQISKSLPDLPQIDFVSASGDEQKLLIHAASLTDPGRYYLLDRATHHMSVVSPVRPELDGYRFGAVKAISYPAGDGTPIPAYLTLPPGSDGKNLPALVMPHGGPESRDYGGFDFLAQFFAQRGFAVIQPEYRGSTGYGDEFYNKNGFHSWRTAIGDVNDAGRWLVKQGIADPAKLAIFGWSYGGYAALQSNVLDPALFKAVVAVAPVTDFDLARREQRDFVDYDLEVARLGDAQIAAEGSPARHASVFLAPVLMFHGDQDINVGIGESRAMDAALHRAGKQSRLVVYPGLDHQLDDSKARADMLAQSDAFLRAQLHLTP